MFGPVFCCECGAHVPWCARDEGWGLLQLCESCVEVLGFVRRFGSDAVADEYRAARRAVERVVYPEHEVYAVRQQRRAAAAYRWSLDVRRWVR